MLNLHTTQYLFNTNFNIAFHVPRSLWKMWRKKGEKKRKDISHCWGRSAHNIHLAEKVAMRKEKEKDKMNKEATTLLAVFDLENVITLVKADVGSLFIKEN